MVTVEEALDTIKERRGLRSDAALARLLDVKPQTLSNWRKGHNLPDAVACARLAELTGEPLARVLGIVGEARAISREEKAVWRRLAAAAVVLIAVGAMPGQPQAKTVLNQALAVCHSIHYAFSQVIAGLRSVLAIDAIGSTYSTA